MNKKGQEGAYAMLGIFLVIIVIGTLMWIIPQYKVWSQEKRGQADLAEADWNRQIQIREAEANLKSEKLNALAEIERAKGVAESNAIIGEGLKDNEEYLRYLWVKGLSTGNNQVIYVPTETNLPILEASRLLSQNNDMTMSEDKEK